MALNMKVLSHAPYSPSLQNKETFFIVKKQFINREEVQTNIEFLFEPKGEEFKKKIPKRGD